MQLFYAEYGGNRRAGLVVEGQAVLMPAAFGDIVNIISGGQEALDAIKSHAARRDSERVALSSLTLLPPISRFRRDILCAGWNYWSHFEEGVGLRGDHEKPRPGAPTFFTKGPGVVIGPYDSIAFDPTLSTRWDYEAEIVVVLGSAGRSVPSNAAMHYVFGYCLANDVSQRDLQQRHGGQWLKGKSIDNTMPLGPYVTTSDDIDLSSTQITCHVNGELRQSAFAAQMAFSVAELVAELSFGMTIYPGDVLLTGTPDGIGHAMKPPRYLAAGDEVVVQATGLGMLRNRLVPVDLHGESDVINKLR